MRLDDDKYAKHRQSKAHSLFGMLLGIFAFLMIVLVYARATGTSADTGISDTDAGLLRDVARSDAYSKAGGSGRAQNAVARARELENRLAERGSAKLAATAALERQVTLEQSDVVVHSVDSSGEEEATFDKLFGGEPAQPLRHQTVEEIDAEIDAANHIPHHPRGIVNDADTRVEAAAVEDIAKAAEEVRVAQYEKASKAEEAEEAHAAAVRAAAAKAKKAKAKDLQEEKAKQEEGAAKAKERAAAAVAAATAAPPATAASEGAASGGKCARHKVLYGMIEENLKPLFDRKIVLTQQEHLATIPKFFATMKEQRAADPRDLITLVQIIDNKLLCVPLEGVEYSSHSACYPSGANFNRIYFVLDLINKTLQEFPGMPNTQFMVSTNDVPLVDKYIFDKGPVPTLFNLGKSDRELDILIPGQSFTSGAWGLTWPDWLSQKNVDNMNAKYPWSKKIEKGFWRGHEQITLPNMVPFRLRAAETTHKGADKDLYDIDMVGGYDPKYKYANKVEMFDHAAYKYLVHIDGSTVSSRFMKLLAMNSVVLKHESVWYEFFEHALRPYEHFIPFHWGVRDKDGDIPELDNGQQWPGEHANLTAQIKWAQANDAEAQQIGLRGQKFAREHLTIPAAECYIKEVLQRYSKLFKGEFVAHAKAEPFSAGSLFKDYANIMGNFKPGNWEKGKM